VTDVVVVATTGSVLTGKVCVVEPAGTTTVVGTLVVPDVVVSLT
jgi:hypothetical protein